jgi:hypothetical protein
MNRHAIWILHGTLIRIAQKMGLHRDGETLGLSPFETEMRRRIWWQIIMQDAKYALLSGLSHSLLPRDWDTKEPKNVNDADLHPAATEPIQDKDGPTEMILLLLMTRMARFLLDTPGIEPMLLLGHKDVYKGDVFGGTKDQIAQYRVRASELAQEMTAVVERFGDASAGPLHEMALEMQSEVEKKVLMLVDPNSELHVNRSEVATRSDDAFHIAVSTADHSMEQHTKIRNSGFSWYARLHFQVSIFAYMVGQLCYRKSGVLVEKAWVVVERTYDLYPDLFDISQKEKYELATFLLRAWRVREGVLREKTGRTPCTPSYVARLQAAMPEYEPKSESSSGVGATPMIKDDMMSPDPDAVQFLGMDPNNMDWDMWGSMVPAGTAMSAFGGFGMGPTTDW